MEQQTVNQIQTGEGLAVVRVENARSQRWDELCEKYNPVETYAVKSDDYTDFYYYYDEKRLTVHTSFQVADGVAVYGENGRCVSLFFLFPSAMASLPASTTSLMSFQS